MARLTPIEIARLEEARIAAGVAGIASEAEPCAGGMLCYEEPGCWANQAEGLGMHGPVSAAELDQLVEFYVSRGVEPRIEVCPFADQSLVDGLGERGFRLLEFENVLAFDLADAIPEVEPPEGLELLRVDAGDGAMVDEFIEVSSSGFREPGEAVTPGLARTIGRVVANLRNDCYLAMLNGEAVGGCGMETAGEIACLFGTSVLEPYRRRGVQQAMIVRRLYRARERGARVVTMLSKPGIATERNAARLGFAMAYTRVTMAMKGEALVASM